MNKETIPVTVPGEQTLKNVLKNTRPATEEELREQGRNLSKNYKPGPRQAVPFMTKVEQRGDTPKEHPLLTGDVTCSECSHNIHQALDGTWVAADGFSCGTTDDGRHVPKCRPGQPVGGHWSQPCGYCGAVAGMPCLNHARTKPIKHVHLKRLQTQPSELESTEPIPAVSAEGMIGEAQPLPAATDVQKQMDHDWMKATEPTPPISNTEEK